MPDGGTVYLTHATGREQHRQPTVLAVSFALVCALQVAVVHGDEQGFGALPPGLPSAWRPLQGGEVGEGRGVARAERARLGPLVG